MNDYILTYWWFGPSTMVPSGLRRTGVAEVRASGPQEAVRQFQDNVGDRRRDGDFLVHSVVELPELDVRGRGLFVRPGEKIETSMVDDVNPDLAVAGTYGRPGANQYVVTGTITGDDQRFVQFLSADRVKGAVYKVLAWLDSEQNVDDKIAEVWSVVERSGDDIRVYQGTDKHRGPGQVETSGASWMRGEFEDVLRASAASATTTAAHPPGLLEKVNRDRVRRQQRALAPGEWSTADLEEFARHLRNPDLNGLKRRLMR